ncbi:MAG: type II toxin-antitoxin system VapC family toxin [Holophagaceae bacterium]|nr:type II toxin-antitoxin system VapC family toxin [Holophagaceae bacterium]
MAFPETLAAFAGKKYSANQLNKINALFLHTWESDCSTVYLGPEICNVSGILVRAHRSLGLRGADSIHLASALRVGAKRSSLTFAVFDRNLAKAASAEGFPLLTDPSFGL